MTRQRGMAAALSTRLGRRPSGSVGVVAEDGRMPFHVADDVARPGIDQQFVGVEAVAFARVVGAVHADAVQRADARQLALDEAVMHRRRFGPAA